MNRRTFLKTTAAAALSTAAAPAILPRRRLNILMIVADDQRHDTIGALGNPHIQTPTLDRLANEGFAFTNTRCMGAQQGAVCVPARAMILSGRTLFHAPEQLPANIPTLPQIFRQAGYTTFGCGKWHNGTGSFSRGFSAGGHIFFGGMNNQFKTPVHDFNPASQYPAKSAKVPGQFSSELFADAGVEFLEKQTGDTPFFCYLAFTSPHDPRTSPAPYNTVYKPADIPLPPNFLPLHPKDTGELKIRDEMLAPFPRTPDNTRQQLCDYYGMITSQDAQVQRLLTALDRSGQGDNTLVLYTGDHGLAIGSHGLFGKQNVYEHSVRVPLLLRGPGIPKQGRSDAIAFGFDLFPTLCELAGVNAPNTIQGKSLSPLLTGQSPSIRDSAFNTYIHPGKTPQTTATQRSLFDGRWKLIEYLIFGKPPITQLFDLAADPHETQDLAQDQMAAAQELPRLRQRLAEAERDA